MFSSKFDVINGRRDAVMATVIAEACRHDVINGRRDAVMATVIAEACRHDVINGRREGSDHLSMRRMTTKVSVSYYSLNYSPEGITPSP